MGRLQKGITVCVWQQYFVKFDSNMAFKFNKWHNYSSIVDHCQKLWYRTDEKIPDFINWFPPFKEKLIPSKTKLTKVILNEQHSKISQFFSLMTVSYLSNRTGDKRSWKNYEVSSSWDSLIYIRLLAYHNLWVNIF